MINLPQDNSGPAELGHEVLAAALELAASGVRVFPVWGVRPRQLELDGQLVTELRCACGSAACLNQGKHPVGALVPHGHNDADTALDTVRQWFQVPYVGETNDGSWQMAPKNWVPYNLGVACGRGLVVIDAESRSTRSDLPTGLEVVDDWESWTGGSIIPETRLIRTGSGGAHLWLRVDENVKIKSRNRVLPGVDVKADGGYVLAPPSAHTSGGFYRVERDVEAAPAPPELLAWLLTAKGGRYVSRKAGDGTAQPPDDYSFQQIIHGSGCPAGHRDYFVNDLCFRLRRAGSTREEAARALRREWLRMEHPPGDVFPWESCAYKLRRVWDEVQPEEVSDIPAWRPPSVQRAEAPAPLHNAGASVNDPAGAAEVLAVSLDQESTVPGSGSGGTAAELLARPDLTFHTSDTGNGARFAQRMREVVRHCTGEGRWYVWDGSRWAPDVVNYALQLTQEVVKDLYVEAADLGGDDGVRLESWARQSEALGKRRAMLESASAEPGIAITPDELDADPWLLVVRNGTLDLRTGLLRQSEPTDLNTRRAEVVFDPAADCPTWLKHIEFVTHGDAGLARWLRRAVGYTLTGLTDEQKLFFLWGNGANGKSTFVDVVAHVLGSYATQADGNLLAGAGDHPTQLAGLRGARLVVADETEQGRKLREQRVKAITGGKRIRARFMRQDYFEFTPRFKLWITGNHKPEIAGTDHGIWRRLKLVPFTSTLTDDTRIMGFDDVLLGEASGILNWALEGLADWRVVGEEGRGGGLGEVEVVQRATREYRDEEDTIGLWLAEVAELGVVDAVTENVRLYDSYRMWCHLNGVTEVKSNIVLGRELGSRGLSRASVKLAGKTARVWRGINLRS